MKNTKINIVLIPAFILLSPLYSQTTEIGELKNSLMNAREPKTKKEAALALAEIGTPEAVRVLVDALKVENDPTRVLKSVAEEALIKTGKPAVDLLVNEMNKNKKLRNVLAKILGEIKDPRSVEPLIKILLKDKPSRASTAQALGKINDPRAVEPLIAVLNQDENPGIKKCAADALRQTEDPRAVEPLLRAMEAQESFVRESVVFALANKIDTLVIDSFLAVIREKKFKSINEIQVESITIKHTPQNHAPYLAAVLRSEKDSKVRSVLVLTLGRIGSAECIPSLLDALTDEDDDVRSCACLELGKASKSKDDAVLIALENGDAVSHLIPFLNAKESYIQESAVEGLINMGYSNLRPIVTALSDGNESVRFQAAVVLDSLEWVPENSDQEVAYLMAAQKWDEVKELRNKAIDPLIRFLKHEDALMRMSSASILGEIKAPIALEDLTYTMNTDPDSNVARAAQFALLNMNDPRCIDLYHNSLDSKDPDLRLRAAKNLANAKQAEAAEVRAKIQKIIEEDSYITEILEYDSYDRAISTVLLNGDGKVILKKTIHYDPFNPNMIRWIQISDPVSGNDIHATTYEFSRPKDPMFVCLDQDGNVILQSGKAVLSPHFLAFQKSVSTNVYHKSGHPKRTITKIYRCQNCTTSTGLSNCRFVWR